MLFRTISIVLGMSLLAACAQNSSKTNEPETAAPLSEKCHEAKQDFEQAVQAGERDNLHELKRNIELYCVWRRY